MVEHILGEIRANASQVQLDSCVYLWLAQLHNQFEDVYPSMYVIIASCQISIFQTNKMSYLHCLYHQTIDRNFP